MAGRNDRRRSNELRARAGGLDRTTRSYPAGMSRPVRSSKGLTHTSQSVRSSRQAQAPSRSTLQNLPSSHASQKSTRKHVGQNSTLRQNGREKTRSHETDQKDNQRDNLHTNRYSASGNRAERMSDAYELIAERDNHFQQSDSESLSESEVISTNVGELRAANRLKRARKKSRNRVMRIVFFIGFIVVILAGWAALYHSPAFSIGNVEVNGVEHLTSEEMAQLANVPSDTTLLRVDIATIESRIRQNAWVSDVQINRVFPSTLQINVIERAAFAVVEIPTGATAVVKSWLVSKDHIWLMPIPDVSSDAAKTTSSKVYEDAVNVLHIVDIPLGTKAEIGKECSDANVNNALDVLSGLTTELSSQVVKISAAGTAETTLFLENGVEIAFGKAEDIRDKERVVLKILEENVDNVSYINVRIVDSPTWRSV